MEAWNWLVHNWFDVLSAVGVIGSLIFTGISSRAEARSRRVANLIALTDSHRDLWRDLYGRKDLSRVLDPVADISSKPVTQEEEVFALSLVQHLNAVFRATQYDFVLAPEHMQNDVGELFSLPVVRSVWEKFKRFQDRDFVQFLETCLRSR